MWPYVDHFCHFTIIQINYGESRDQIYGLFTVWKQTIQDLRDKEPNWQCVSNDQRYSVKRAALHALSPHSIHHNMIEWQWKQKKMEHTHMKNNKHKYPNICIVTIITDHNYIICVQFITF